MSADESALSAETRAELRAVPIWDISTRCFHWINALSLIGLVGLGLLMLNFKPLGVSTEGKILVKTIHVWIGYVFVLNLLWRFVWAFIGNKYARWRAILPGGPQYVRALKAYISSFLAGTPQHYLGHNPVGRLGIAALLFLMAVQAITGLVIAGTDLFYPPFGHWIAQWIAAPGVDPSSLVPYATETYDKVAYQDMRAMRAPVLSAHLTAFYALMIAVVIHIAGVLGTELREGGSIISAMFTGKKIVSGKPADDPSDRT